MAISREKLAELCDARDKLCGYCEVYECEKCIVTRLIDDAHNECEDEPEDETMDGPDPEDCFECDAEHWAYNPQGICRFPALYHRQPVWSDDKGCEDFCYIENGE